MFKKIKPNFTVQKNFNILCNCMKILGTWPVHRRHNKIFTCLNHSLWWFYVVNHMMLLLPTMQTFYNTTKDIISASYSLIEITGIVESMVILITFKLQGSRIQLLLQIIKNQIVVKKPKPALNNRNVHASVFAIIAVLYVIVVYMYIHKPATLINKGFIMTTCYAFPTEDIRTKIAIYCNQLIALMHTSVVLVTDGVAVLFIYTCAIKLKTLEIRLKKAPDWTKLKYDIAEHQTILLVIEETNSLAGVLVVKTVICFMCYSISAGVQIINQHVVTAQMLHQFIIIAIVYLRIYICAETAEMLLTVNGDMLFTVYSIAFSTPNIVKVKSLIIMRCQKVPKIYVNGLMAALNRAYLRSISYATFSYFMTIRAIVSK
ncbi:odorant receptor 50 [Nasonia vitripennis]|uniref:Odorant receptor n=1 Tax=Nasonia vitripennis TaxID=7425 RepID=A0A7M6UGU1_NASVI|nr:odorant receptor 50 [Nasonia vitripennis]